MPFLFFFPFFFSSFFPPFFQVDEWTKRALSSEQERRVVTSEVMPVHLSLWKLTSSGDEHLRGSVRRLMAVLGMVRFIERRGNAGI